MGRGKLRASKGREGKGREGKGKVWEGKGRDKQDQHEQETWRAHRSGRCELEDLEEARVCQEGLVAGGLKFDSLSEISIRQLLVLVVSPQQLGVRAGAGNREQGATAEVGAGVGARAGAGTDMAAGAGAGARVGAGEGAEENLHVEVHHLASSKRMSYVSLSLRFGLNKASTNT
eukprot:28359-Hanusia_phi.AAC.3